MRWSICLAFLLNVSLAYAGDSKSPETLYTGEVVDANGRPVGGAVVKAYEANDVNGQMSDMEIASCTTMAQGEYRMSCKAPAGSVLVCAKAKGSSWGYSIFPEASITLDEPSHVDGLVVDEAGNPIAGAQVRLVLTCEAAPLIIGSDPLTWLVATSDANGSFRFSELPRNVRFWFLVTAAGKARQAFGWDSGYTHQYTPGDEGVKLVLKDEGVISGVIERNVDGGSVPVRATILAERRGGWDWNIGRPRTSSDANGRFVFRGLEEGEYTLRTVGDSGPPEFVAVKRAVKVESGKTESGMRLLATDGGKVEVIAVDDLGRAVPRALVIAHERTFGPDGGWIETAETDSNGVAVLRLPLGRYEIDAHTRGYSYLDRPQKIMNVSEGAKRRLVMEMRPDKVMTGRVRDMEGRAVADALVRWNCWSNWQEGRADGNGFFQITYEWSPTLDMKPQGMLVATQVERGLAVAIRFEDSNKPAELILRPGVTLSGQVVTEGNRPVSGARVAVEDDRFPKLIGPGRLADATTDGNGRYQIRGLPSGVYKLGAWGNGFGYREARIRINDGNESQRVGAIEIAPAKLSISGIVKDANGRAVVGADVRIADRGYLKTVARTDKNGAYLVGGLVEGEIMIRVDAFGGSSGSARAKAGEKDVVVVVKGRSDQD